MKETKNAAAGVEIDDIDDAELLALITTDANFRIPYFEHDFRAFFKYHFGWLDEAPFEEEWDEAIEDESKNLIFEAFRGSRKTTKLRGYVVWCIAYAKEPYIIVQSYEGNLSSEWVRQVAKMLMEESILKDYGTLFPFSVKREEISKASFSDFESTTGVKIASKSLGEVLRGANDYNKEQGSIRPTLLIIDDIDTTDSVKNPRVIDQNWRKLTGETIDSLDQFRRRVIVLGNTIAEDGIVPRFKEMAAGKKNWKVFHQPLIYPDGRNAWSVVFTPEVVENLKTTPIAFQQNYELIPYKNGQTVIPRTSFRFAKAAPAGARIVFGIDPAFSEKTNTDAMGLAVVAHIGEQRYILAVYGFEEGEKNEEKFCTFVEALYHQHGCSLIRIESQNGGQIIGRMLQRRNLAVQVISASRDKMTRLMEQEGRFARGEVYFLPGTEAAQDQLANFPNAEHDDMVDAIVYGIDGGMEIFTGSF